MRSLKVGRLTTSMEAKTEAWRASKLVVGAETHVLTGVLGEGPAGGLRQYDKTQLLPFRKAHRNPEDIQDEERASEGEPADDGPQLCNFFWCGSALQEQSTVNQGLPVEERQYTCVAGVMPWEGRGEWRRG